MVNIVTEIVSQQVAPTPNTLQRMGCFVAQGATNTSINTSSLLTQLSDLTPLLLGTKTITSMALSGGVVTVTTTTPHGFANGDTLWLTIAGVVPAGYNGSYLCTITGASTFTYLTTLSLASVTVQGVYSNEDVGELLSMATTFFAQGSTAAAYVLELGLGSPNEGIAALSAYLVANPNINYTPGASGFYYVYEVPRTWDANPNFLTLLQSYENMTARVYFMVTTTLTTYTSYTALMKCVRAIIESPAQGVWSANVLTAQSFSAGEVTFTTTAAHGIAVGQWFQINGSTPAGYNGWWQAQIGTTGSTIIAFSSANIAASTVLGTVVASYYANSGITATEFTASAMMWNIVNQQPGATNKVRPFAFDYWYGVTPFPTRGNQALLSTLKTANITICGTGAEGGISNTIDLWGTTLDGNDFSYWYSVDWIQVNADLMISNAVINGSNDPVNPLYYNQPGIDRLQAVVASVVSRGVAFGLVLGLPVQTSLDGAALSANIANNDYVGKSVVNAVPFIPYSIANPSDYKLGRYAGFSIVYVPARGFTSIVLNIVVSQFVAT